MLAQLQRGAEEHVAVGMRYFTLSRGEGLAQHTASGEQSSAALFRTIKQLAPRWFVMRNARASEDVALMQPRWPLSFLRGPMTPWEIRRVRGEGAAGGKV